MKKIILLYILVLTSHSFFAQVFNNINALLPQLQYSKAEWGDYDADGDLDFVLLGWETNGYISKIFRNDGNNVFTDINAGLPAVAGGDLEWGDYDNDNDLDLVITGNNLTTSITKIYRNDGNNIFTDINAALIGVESSSVNFGDYDNDGDLDLLLTGLEYLTQQGISKIYKNNQGAFLDINANLPAIFSGRASWGDYDNDGDLDIVLIGVQNSKIYRNDSGIFNNLGINLINGGAEGYVTWVDYDNDGDLDIFLLGEDFNANEIANIYKNNGNSTFTNINANLVGVDNGSGEWGDMDNDGDLDLLLTGATSNGLFTTKIYRNNSGIFNDINVGIPGVRYGSAVWGDFDGEDDLDILITGELYSNPAKLTRIYRNDSLTNSNTPPVTPSGLTENFVGNTVTLRWNKATDIETPSNGLTYNVRIGTTSMGYDIVSPMANVNTGKRFLARMGNAELDTIFILKNLPPGNYYWSVQTIDNNFEGSPFSQVKTFSVITDINEIDENLTTIFPNPVLKEFNLNFPTHKEEGILKIFDVLGNLVLQEQIPALTEYKSIDISGLNSGVYFCKINWEDKRANVKLIKQ